MDQNSIILPIFVYFVVFCGEINVCSSFDEFKFNLEANLLQLLTNARAFCVLNESHGRILVDEFLFGILILNVVPYGQ